MGWKSLCYWIHIEFPCSEASVHTPNDSRICSPALMGTQYDHLYFSIIPTLHVFTYYSQIYIYVNYIFFYIQFYLYFYLFLMSVEKLTCNVTLLIISKFAAVLLVIKCFALQLKSLTPHVCLDWVKCLCEKTVQVSAVLVSISISKPSCSNCNII